MLKAAQVLSDQSQCAGHSETWILGKIDLVKNLNLAKIISANGLVSVGLEAAFN